jgi:tetratricopeptide (TPR) repeat protein
MRSNTLVHKELRPYHGAGLFLVVIAATALLAAGSVGKPAALALGDDAASASASEQMAARVDRYINALDYVSAAKAAEELAASYPGYVKGWMLLGYCRSMMSDFAGSNEAYDRALTLGVKPDLVYSRKAYNYVRLADFAEARRCYRAILDLKGADREVLEQLGYVETKLGDLDASADYYRRALETSPDDIEIMVALAGVEARRGRSAAVKELLEKANLLAPDNTDVLGRLGVIYMREKDYKAAVETLAKLVSLDPRDADGQRNLGVVYYQTGDKVSAVGPFERAKALGEDFDGLYGPLADCYVAASRPEDALRVIEEGVKKGVQKAWLYSLWGNILEDAKDFDGAIAKFSLAARAGEDPWSDYAKKQIARQSELKQRERVMEGSIKP